MNRRELLQAALGTSFASGITEVQIKFASDSTPPRNVPVIILEEGMSLEALRLPKD